MSDLHNEKLAILSRLIKQDALSLQEALTLLKEEEVPSTFSFNLTSGTTATSPYVYPSTGYDTLHTPKSYHSQLLDQLINE